jgi:O-antigen/teichoic acid export membrane protein
LSTVQRVARNTGIIIVGDVIFRLISLIVIIYLARYLGTVGFGKYSFVFAYLTFFAVLPDLGLDAILVRDIARDKSIASKLIGNVYIIKSILAAFAVVLSMIVITLMSYPSDITTYIYIAALTLFFLPFSEFYSTMFQVNLRMEYNVISKLVFKVLSAGLIFWIIFAHGTLAQIMIILVFSEGIRALISYIFSRKFVKPRFEIDFELWKYLIKESLPLALSVAIWVIYYQIDMVMLYPMVGDEAVGVYSAAHKLFGLFSLIPMAIMISLFPIMSEAFKSSKDRLLKSYRFSIKYLLIIALPVAIGVILLADKIILLIFGVLFTNSSSVLRILMISIVFTFMSSVLLNILIAIDKQKLHTLSTGTCAIVNVILNFMLIPILSYNGAAIATVATNVVLFVASFYFVSKHLQVLPIHKILIKPIIGSLLMSAFVYYFIDFNIFLLVPLAGVVYLVALLSLKTFTKEDLDIVKKIVVRG